MVSWSLFSAWPCGEFLILLGCMYCRCCLLLSVASFDRCLSLVCPSVSLHRFAPLFGWFVHQYLSTRFAYICFPFRLVRVSAFPHRFAFVFPFSWFGSRCGYPVSGVCSHRRLPAVQQSSTVSGYPVVISGFWSVGGFRLSGSRFPVFRLSDSRWRARFGLFTLLLLARLALGGAKLSANSSGLVSDCTVE